MYQLQITPHLIPKTTYPLLDRGYNLFKLPESARSIRRLDRLQVRIAPDRFAIMVRHFELGHWCGYAMTQEARWAALPYEWVRNLRDHAPERISFAGPANAYISWCVATRKTNRLSIPISIQADQVDFWVGFSAYGEPPIAEPEDFYQRLLTFERYIWENMNAHSGA